MKEDYQEMFYNMLHALYLEGVTFVFLILFAMGMCLLSIFILYMYMEDEQ